jgi:hypothetical protein
LALETLLTLGATNFDVLSLTIDSGIAVVLTNIGELFFLLDKK